MSQSLLIPLRTARSVGIPITRSILAPVVEQIVSTNSWKDALTLLDEEQQVLSRNTDLCKLLVSRTRFPSSPSSSQSQASSSINSFPSSSSSQQQQNATSAAATSSFTWQHSLEFLQKAATCVGEDPSSKTFLNEFVGSDNILHICKQLAYHGRWREFLEFKNKHHQNNNNSSQAQQDQQQKEIFHQLEIKALLNAGRWISAVKIFSERIENNNSSSSSSSSSSPQQTISNLLFHPTTMILLKRLKRHSRWVEGCNIFEICFQEAQKMDRMHHERKELFNKSKNSNNNNKSPRLIADILGASIATIATSSQQHQPQHYHHHHHQHRASSNSSTSSSPSSWWKSLFALSQVQRKLPHLPVTIHTIEAASLSSPAARRIIENSALSDQRHHHPHQPRRAAEQEEERAGGGNRSNNSRNDNRSHHQQNDRQRNNDQQHHHQYQHHRAGGRVDTKAGARAAAIILDLVKSGQWQSALNAFQRLPPTQTSFWAAGRSAGAIMNHLSRLDNWSVAFHVYNSVLTARARVTGCTKMQESDQRALLFVCSQQQRWKEAFSLLATKISQGNNNNNNNNDDNNDTNKIRKEKRHSFGSVVAKRGKRNLQNNSNSNNNNNDQDDDDDSSNYYFPSSDRIAVAFQSNAPWDRALQLARVTWPMVAGDEKARSAILSCVAAAALAKGRSSSSSSHHSSPSSSSNSSRQAQKEDQRKRQQRGEREQEQRGGGDGPLQVGIQVVKRMIAQNLFPRGNALAMLPRKHLLEILALNNNNSNKNDNHNNRYLPMAETLHAIRLLVRPSSYNPPLTIQPNWFLSLELASLCFSSLSSSRQNNNNNSNLSFKVKLCKAATETLDSFSKSIHYDDNHHQQQYENQQQNRRRNPNDVRERMLLLENETELQTQERHSRTRWLESLKVISALSKILSSSSSSSSENSDSRNNTFKSNNSTSDDNDPLHQDLRIIFANTLHLVSSVSPLAVSIVVDEMKKHNIPLRYVSKSFSPFLFDSVLCGSESNYSANNNNNNNNNGNINDGELALSVLGLLRSERNLASLDQGSLSIPVLREAFFFCATNFRKRYCSSSVSNFNVQKEMAKEGLEFFKLMCKSDDAVRKIDGGRVAQLCSAAYQDEEDQEEQQEGNPDYDDNNNNNNNDQNEIRERYLEDIIRKKNTKKQKVKNLHAQEEEEEEEGWLQALKYFNLLNERALLDHGAVESFMREFDSQWMLATKLFMKQHRDAVFRSLLAKSRV